MSLFTAKMYGKMNFTHILTPQIFSSRTPLVSEKTATLKANTSRTEASKCPLFSTMIKLLQLQKIRQVIEAEMQIIRKRCF